MTQTRPPRADGGATGAGRLDARVTGRRGTMDFDLRVSLEPGDVLAVLGPNGAGKSTLLECLAGVLTPTGGHIALDGRELFRAGDPRISGGPDEPARGAARDRAAPRGGRSVPPARRGIGLLGQEPRLFPHLSVRDNVAFAIAHGRRAERMPRARARAQADEWLARVGLDGVGERRPRQLSGGQQQRVAIARALAARPAVLLLDEPLASLDVEVAPEIRRVLREQLRATGTSAVLVSHDVLDAVAMADRVAVVERGRIVESGRTAEALLSPRTPFLATLAGVNLVLGVAAGGLVVAGQRAFAGTLTGTGTGTGSGAPASAPGPAEAPTRPGVSAAQALPDGVRAAAVFRPSSVIVATSRPEGTSLRNIWSDRIVAVEPSPGGARLRFAQPALSADVTAAALAELGLGAGDEVWLAVKASEVGLHTLD
jgi:molybdate transport system ATP-binding protein